MRKTVLNRTTVVVLGVLIVVAVGLAILRNILIAHSENHELHGERMTHDTRMSEAASRGAALFNSKGCAQCHPTDSTKGGMAPSLKELFQRKTLPVSGRPATEENVRKQLQQPYKDMPSFADRLTDKEREQIIIYLKTL